MRRRENTGHQFVGCSGGPGAHDDTWRDRLFPQTVEPGPIHAAWNQGPSDDRGRLPGKRKRAAVCDNVKEGMGYKRQSTVSEGDYAGAAPQASAARVVNGELKGLPLGSIFYA